MELEQKILTHETVHQGAIFAVDRMSVQLPDGRTVLREATRHQGACAIVACDDATVLLVQQARVAVDKILYELPAGRIDPGEDPLSCAQRELAEETGYRAAHWRALCRGFSSPGFCDEMLHLFYAEDLTSGETHLDEDEFVAASWVPLATAMDWISQGKIIDMKTIAGISLAWAASR